MKVTIGVVLYGGTKYFDQGLASLFNQDYKNIEYLAVDQEENVYSASEYIKKEKPQWLEKINLSQGSNRWHSGGMNFLLKKMTGELFIVASVDMNYPRDFVSKIVEFFQANPQIDFACPRLQKWDFDNQTKKTDIIDSLGIKINQNHQAFEIGEGQNINQFSFGNPFNPVFGVSGALMILTKKCLEQVMVGEELFDETLHYKNDVDLSYRLQWANCQGAIINDLVVYHHRFMGKNSEKPYWVKKQSLFGDWTFIQKNFSSEYSFLTKLKTFGYLWLKTIFLIIKTPKLIEVYGLLKKNKQNLNRWKKTIKRNISAQEMESRLK